MSSLLTVGKVVGWNTLLRMRKVRKSVWEDLIAPHFTTRCLQTLLNVGFLDELRKGPQSPAEFAEKNGLNPRLLLSICEALYARKLFVRVGPKFALDEAGKLIMESNLARGWLELALGYESPLHQMEPLVRNLATYGTDVVRNGKWVGSGSGLASVDFYFPLVRKILRDQGSRCVLDIGCGDGMFLRSLCTEMPSVRGVGLDLSPEAVAEGRLRVAREGLAERIQLHVGNALDIGRFQAELAGVDAVTTFFVLHELCDNDKNPLLLEFLKQFRAALPNVPFHVIETVRPQPDEMRQRPGPAIEYFLFHDLSGQNPVGREEWQRLFRTAGFPTVEEDYLAFVRSSIYTLN